MSVLDTEDGPAKPVASLTAGSLLKKRTERKIRSVEDLERMFGHIDAFRIHEVSYADMQVLKPTDHVRLREEAMRRIVAEQDPERRQEMVRRLDERCAEIRGKDKAA